MADEPDRKKRRIRKTETIRQRAEKEQQKSTQPKRRTRISRIAGRPLKGAKRIGSKSYYIKLPDNKLGRFLNRRVRFVPKYFRDSWQELRLVNWPNSRDTAKLTIAVILFATIFGLFIVAIDFGLDRAFRKLFL